MYIVQACIKHINIIINNDIGLWWFCSYCSVSFTSKKPIIQIVGNIKLHSSLSIRSHKNHLFL